MSRIDAYASSDCVGSSCLLYASCPFTASDDLRIEIIFFEITKDPEYYRTKTTAGSGSSPIFEDS